MSDRATRRILEGPLAWEVLRFGLPLALGAVLQAMFNLVDAYLIAQLPKSEVGAAIGALGVCDQIAAIGTIFSYGVSTATATLIASHKGKGDDAAFRHVAWQSMIVVFALSLLFGLGSLGAGILARNVVGLKGAVADVATRYLRVILAGSGTMFFLLQLTSIQRALGSSKTPVALLVLSNVLNVVFAVWCLFGDQPPNDMLAWGAPAARLLGIPRLGMVGAAWATVVARALVLVPMVMVLVRRFDIVPKARRAPDAREIRTLLALAWPTSAQLVLRIAAMLFVNSLVARFYSSEADQTATTAMGLVFRVDSLALFVAMGWGGAAQTFVAQNLGAGHAARALRAGWLAALYDVLTNVLFVVLILFFAESVLRFFGKEDAPVALGVQYLHVVAPSYVALGAGIVLGNGMAGGGATRTAFGVDVAVMIGFQLPLCFIAILAFDVKLTGLFGCVAATAVASALLYAVVYARGHWQRAMPVRSTGAPPGRERAEDPL